MTPDQCDKVVAPLLELLETQEAAAVQTVLKEHYAAVQVNAEHAAAVVKRHKAKGLPHQPNVPQGTCGAASLLWLQDPAIIRTKELLQNPGKQRVQAAADPDDPEAAAAAADAEAASIAVDVGLTGQQAVQYVCWYESTTQPIRDAVLLATSRVLGGRDPHRCARKVDAAVRGRIASMTRLCATAMVQYCGELAEAQQPGARVKTQVALLRFGSKAAAVTAGES